MCGNFPKEKIWHIGLDEFRNAIAAAIKYADANWSKATFPEQNKFICIFGGEPTFHPNWNEMVNIVYEFEAYPFVVYTNGFFLKDLLFQHVHVPGFGRGSMSDTIKTLPLPRNGYAHFKSIFDKYHCHNKNLCYKIDYKTKDFNVIFFPTLVAAKDVLKIEERAAYWKLAQKQCVHWLGEHFETTIYKNKAYFCQVGAALDFMFNDARNGWLLDEKNPMDKSDDEIAKQANELCYRCGFCLGSEPENKIGKVQRTCDKSLVTEINILSSGKVVKL